MDPTGFSWKIENRVGLYFVPETTTMITSSEKHFSNVEVCKGVLFILELKKSG